MYAIRSYYDFERGYCKDKLNDFDGAIEDYTKSIKENSKNPDA